MSDIVYLSLGSNVGDRKNYIESAIDRLNSIEGIEVINRSNIYETKPVGNIEQDDFLNIIISAEVIISPAELLVKIHEIEDEFGRIRTVRWGPRTMDIDIVLWGKKEIIHDDLIIPHKEMFNREFVLVPLKEIYDRRNTIEIDFKEKLKKLDLKKVRRYNG